MDGNLRRLYAFLHGGNEPEPKSGFVDIKIMLPAATLFLTNQFPPG